jgi:pimeloyl-ACP methyl ester carboxylesterase
VRSTSLTDAVTPFSRRRTVCGVPYDGSYLASLVGQLDGPVVFAGHSYGGVVITIAGSSSKVAGLVYVAGLVPDDGEAVNDLQGRFPSLAIGTLVRPASLPDGSMEISIDSARFHDVFCADLPADDAAFMAISQRPWRQRRSTIPSPPLPGVRSRPRRCSARPTSPSLRNFTASPTTVPVPRSPKSKAPPTSS